MKRGDLDTIRSLLGDDPNLANTVSETDPRLTYPLHVAAEFGQAEAARALIALRAPPRWSTGENDRHPRLGWAASSAGPAFVDVLLKARVEPNGRNKHGLTPLNCALRGAHGERAKFSNATAEDWRRAAEIISAAGGKA